MTPIYKINNKNEKDVKKDCINCRGIFKYKFGSLNDVMAVHHELINIL